MNSKSTLIVFFLLAAIQLSAQDITFAFENPQITAAGPFSSYEVDVVASTTSPYKLGSGQIYINYNTAAFGSSVVTNGNLFISTSGAVLGQTSGPFQLYTSFISNDNTTSRFSFSWQQALSSACMTDNITTSTSVVFHIRLDFINGGSSQSNDLCFESVSPFDDQTFTACGPGGSCSFTDCVGSPGIQITNDTYNCAGSALPVDLLSFTVQKKGKADVFISWISEQELNSDYYQLERSTDAKNWEAIHQTGAAGTSYHPIEYSYLDEEVATLNSFQLYYRLKIVDLDRNFEYSEIRTVSIQLEKDDVSFNIYPNPASEGVYIDMAVLPSTYKLLRLYDSQGKIVRTIALAKEAKLYFLEFGDRVSQGLYWMVIDIEGSQPIKKAIVVSR